MASQSKPTNSKAYARSNASSTSQASGTGTAASRHSNVNAARDEESKTLPSNEKASYDSHFTSYLYPFAGMIHDVRVRMPHYWSDITDGFTYRTLAATLRIYFLNLIPALAYTMDMYKRTHQNYGENEALLASALGGIVFGVFSVQPITIVGITGLINLFNYTSWDIIAGRYDVPYLPFMAWVAIWAAIFHWLIAIFNFVNLVRYVTAFTAETFGFYVGIVYIQKGIELIVEEFDANARDGFMSTVLAFAFFFSYWVLTHLGSSSYFHRNLRILVSDFAMAICVVFWTGFAFIPGDLKNSDVQTLPVTTTFQPTLPRDWFVPFYTISVGYVFVALPFGLLVTALFYFDHNVSSLTAQAKHYPLTKPAGFHWDFFLLGVTTIVAGFLGIPYPNALVPQAPMHTDSLSVWKQVEHNEQLNEEDQRMHNPRGIKRTRPVLVSVKEQRMSNFLQGLLCLGTMTHPLLLCLGLIPRAVLAGVFIGVGWSSIETNKITKLTLWLVRDLSLVDPRTEPLMRISRKQVAHYVGYMWLGFATTFAISQTIAAIGFPILILALIPFRATWMNKLFTQTELDILDSPVASDLPLESIGGLPDCVANTEARERLREKEVEAGEVGGA